LYNWSYGAFRYKEKEVVFVWPGAVQIGVKLNQNVFSLQQQISAKFHPDQSTFGRMVAEKKLFKKPVKYNSQQTAPSINVCTGVLNMQDLKIAISQNFYIRVIQPKCSNTVSS